MLKIVKGADRLALTQYAFRYIKDDIADRKQAWILIVPEQFSFEAERKLCLVGGDTIGRYAEVLSFSRLADRVAAKQGGTAGEYLDKGGQLLSMALAAEQVASRIKLYASVIRKPEFLTDMVAMIGEFRSYCLGPEELLRVARSSEGRFAQKLEELGILYEAYLAVCANGKADPSDKLDRAIAAMEDCSWIGERCFYIDGFSDFTGVEMQLIGHLLSYGREVVISLPCGEKGSVMHRLAGKNADALIMLAQKRMARVAEADVEETVQRTRALDMLLRDAFTYGKVQEQPESDGVRLVVCSSVEEECRMAALIAAEKIMDGARYRDISVACTDRKRYEVPLANAFAAAGIPAYFAGERALLAKPVVAGLLNCLFAACGPMEHEDVSLYLRSGLAPVTRQQCDEIDGYAYLWNIKGARWSSEWAMHPRGFAERMTEDDSAFLKHLNETKDLAMGPLLSLRKAMLSAEDTGSMVLALYDFMEAVSLRTRLEEKAQAYAAEGQNQRAQELMQIYEILLASLEQLWFTLGKTSRSADDFCRLYQTVLTQYEVATIPAGVDQVHVSDVPDLRYKQTDHLIVLGTSDGDFPSYKTTEGLLTEDERKLLVAQGVSIAPGKADRLDQELSRICFALDAATQSLSLLYSGDQPSWLFRRAATLCPNALQTCEENAILNEQELAAKRLRLRDESLCPIDAVKDIEEKLKVRCAYTFTPLEKKTVEGLYGAPIVLSPSKIDKYAACRFGFFLTYGLKAKARKQAKLDQPAFGTFVHAVLEHTVLRVNEAEGFQEVTQEQILEIAAEEIARYAKEYFPEQALRDAYLFDRSVSEIKDIVIDLWEELRKSQFQPRFCELQFAGNDTLPAVHIDGTQTSCKVVGMVDRVDVFEHEGKAYVRVVDYKTGLKEFDYTDILNGAGLQMLIYLFALQTMGDTLFDGMEVQPAGVLYLPAKRAYPRTEPMPDDAIVQMKHRELRRRKGLIRCDAEVLAAMEEDPDVPVFMPYKVGKNGLSGDLADERQMKLLESHVTRTIAEMADRIIAGDVRPDPIVRGQYSSCKYCDHKTVCHKDLDTQEVRVFAETSASKFWEKLEQEGADHG